MERNIPWGIIMTLRRVTDKTYNDMLTFFRTVSEDEDAAQALTQEKMAETIIEYYVFEDGTLEDVCKGAFVIDGKYGIGFTSLNTAKIFQLQFIKRDYMDVNSLNTTYQELQQCDAELDMLLETYPEYAIWNMEIQ